MRVFFMVGSGIGNQVETVPAFKLAQSKYDDIVVVNAEPYNYEATKAIFKGMAPVRNIKEVDISEADLQIATYFCFNSVKGIPRAFDWSPKIEESEVEFNMKSTGLEYTDDDFANTEGFLDYIEPDKDAPDVIIHDGFNKTNCGKLGKEKWAAKSYAHWPQVASLLKGKGLSVGSIGSKDERIPGTEDFTGLPLEESLSIIKGAKIVLCNDTGTYHLCNLTKTECIVVFTFTDHVKNYDARFHRYSKLLLPGLPCSPCQPKGKHCWIHYKKICNWKCREHIPPEKVEELALEKINRRKEMAQEKTTKTTKSPKTTSRAKKTPKTTTEDTPKVIENSVMSNEETITDLKERFASGKPFSYLRFGDADLYFIDNPRFDRNKRHDASFGMSAELERAFTINDDDYLIGCVAGGAVFGKGESRFIDIANKYHQGTAFHSAVALQVLYTKDPKGFISFCKECFWGKKVLIIGGESVAKNSLVHKAFNVKASIRLTDRNAYKELDSRMEHIEKNVPHFDIIVSALGQATRVLGHRLWVSGLRTQYFDVGSVVDALAGRDLRTWIKKVPELKAHYEQEFYE